MTNLLVTNLMNQSQTSLTVFSLERPLFLREYATKHYTILPYFCSHLMIEILMSFVTVMVRCVVTYFMIGLQQELYQMLAVMFVLSLSSTAIASFLGSIFSNAKIARSMLVPIVIPQFYFSVRCRSVFCSLASPISPLLITSGVSQGLFIPTNMIPVWVRWAQWVCTLTYASRLAMIYEFGDCESEICDEFLSQNGAEEDAKWWYWLALIALFFFFRSLAVITLRRKGRRFP